MNGFTIVDGKLQKEFIFQSFTEAIAFVNEVARVSETINHHPDIFIHSYKKVSIFLMTHDQGCITEKDYALAQKIDEIPYVSHG